MTVYIECADPRVLAEHQKATGADAMQVFEPNVAPETWTECGSPWTAEAFAAFMGGTGVRPPDRFRLVFPSPEAAGARLVDYRDRLGARLESLDRKGPWRPSNGVILAEYIARYLAERPGCYRIAAPAAAEEPRPEPEEPLTERQRERFEAAADRALAARRVAGVLVTRPEWRGWAGYLGRAIGGYTESEGGTSEDTLAARRRLFEVYDEWVDAERPEHDPPPAGEPQRWEWCDGTNDEEGQS